MQEASCLDSILLFGKGLKLRRHEVSGRYRRLRRPAEDSGNNRGGGGASWIKVRPGMARGQTGGRAGAAYLPEFTVSEGGRSTGM